MLHLQIHYISIFISISNSREFELILLDQRFIIPMSRVVFDLLAILFWKMLVFHFLLLNFYVFNTHSIEHKTVVLLGDELVDYPFRNYALGEKIKMLTIYDNSMNLPLTLNIINEGINGSTIKDINKRATNVLKKYAPQAVFLFWESDITTIDENIFALNGEDLISDYRNNLINVCNIFLDNNVDLAIAGPAVIGEYSANGASTSKAAYLDTYREVNKQVASQLGVSYIDIRSAFIDDAKGNPTPSNIGYDTVDGILPNNRGTVIIASRFAAQINSWLLTNNASMYSAPSWILAVSFAIHLFECFLFIVLYSFLVHNSILFKRKSY